MKSRNSTLRLTVMAVMAAMVCVVSYIRIPFFGTSLHMANAVCVLCGLLLGPLPGFVAAGIGSFLFDLLSGYGAEGFITLVSKGAIGLVSGLIAYKAAHKETYTAREHGLIILASILGALSYVALYMLKTCIFGYVVYNLATEGVIARMLSKLWGSLINAVFAAIATPILFHALRPALRHTALWETC